MQGTAKQVVWEVRKERRTNLLSHLVHLFVAGLGWTEVEVKRATSIMHDHPIGYDEDGNIRYSTMFARKNMSKCARRIFTAPRPRSLTSHKRCICY